MTPQEWIKDALPCPFCGAAPDFEPKDPKREGAAWALVFCCDESCPANGGANVTNQDDNVNFHPVEEAVKLWNKRSTPKGATHLAAALEEITEIRKASAWIVDCEKWDSGTQLLNEKAVAQARIEHRRSSMQVSPTLPPSIEEWMMLVARKQGRDESAEEIAKLREDLAKAESFAESMRKNRDEVLRSSQQDARDAARLKLVVHNVYAAIGNEVSR